MPCLAGARGSLVAALLCFGFWQLGQGAYIPAKAWVAQEMMQRAWVRSAKQGGRQPACSSCQRNDGRYLTT